MGDARSPVKEDTTKCQGAHKVATPDPDTTLRDNDPANSQDNHSEAEAELNQRIWGQAHQSTGSTVVRSEDFYTWRRNPFIWTWSRHNRFLDAHVGFLAV